MPMVSSPSSPQNYEFLKDSALFLTYYLKIQDIIYLDSLERLSDWVIHTNLFTYFWNKV